MLQKSNIFIVRCWSILLLHRASCSMPASSILLNALLQIYPSMLLHLFTIFQALWKLQILHACYNILHLMYTYRYYACKTSFQNAFISHAASRFGCSGILHSLAYSCYAATSSIYASWKLQKMQSFVLQVNINVTIFSKKSLHDAAPSAIFNRLLQRLLLLRLLLPP